MSGLFRYLALLLFGCFSTMSLGTTEFNKKDMIALIKARSTAIMEEHTSAAEKRKKLDEMHSDILRTLPQPVDKTWTPKETYVRLTLQLWFWSHSVLKVEQIFSNNLVNDWQMAALVSEAIKVYSNNKVHAIYWGELLSLLKLKKTNNHNSCDDVFNAINPGNFMPQDLFDLRYMPESNEDIWNEEKQIILLSSHYVFILYQLYMSLFEALGEFDDMIRKIAENLPFSDAEISTKLIKLPSQLKGICQNPMELEKIPGFFWTRFATEVDKMNKWRQWLMFYMGVALECDRPILEAIDCGF